MTLPYAEEVNYWRTGKGPADDWIDKAKRQIEEVGGIVHGEAYGRMDGRHAYMLAFGFGPDDFRIEWPVLESQHGDESAARRQAATFVYHDVKAKCMAVKIKGPRVAFFEYLLLNGRTMSSYGNPELAAAIPKMLTGGEQ